MKIFITGNNQKEIKNLSKKLNIFYNIKIFSIENNTSIKDINKIAINNKEWIIEGNNEENIETLFNLSETIIFIDLKNKLFIKNTTINNEKIYKLLKKHIRKGIILKNKKEIKKYLKSVYESFNY